LQLREEEIACKYVERAGVREGLGDLADKINEEHRPSQEASGTEPDCHAIRANRLIKSATHSWSRFEGNS